MPQDISLKTFESAMSDVLFYCIGEGAIVFDDQGIIRRVNNVAKEILGFDSEEMIGKWFPDVFIAEDEKGNIIPRMERPSTEVFLTGKSITKRLYYRKKDGGRVPVALNVSPIVYQGKPFGGIELFRDITDEIKLEKAKDEFISISSHQLRTPATIVKQYLGMILQGFIVDPKEQLKMIETAYEHNENQLDIINQLLQVARAESQDIEMNPKETNLVEFMNKIINEQRQSFDNRNIKLEVKCKIDCLNCRIDRLHMRMVFENLLNNASKYSPEDSKVIVRIDAKPKGVRISIKDQGPGIHAKDLPRLFQKFSRAENNSATVDGTGLGLYWAKKLVEIHKGKISVKSTPGKGTTFTVDLPIDA